MSYIGAQPTQIAFISDLFSGDGTTTAFTMSVAPANTASILVSITGVLQQPDAYSIVGTTLNFSGAPPAGTANISVRYLGVPASGVATTAYRTVTEFTATVGQVLFTPPSYTVGFINVYRNGVRLGSADYTASNGTTVTLKVGCAVGDLVVIESMQVSSVLNAIPASPASINTQYLVDSAVTTAKIADGSITTSKQVDASITPSKMANGGAEFYSNNLLINPSFEIWQRGTTVTDWGSFGYTADNVQIGYDGSPPSGRTLTRQTFSPGQTDILEGDPRYYAQYSFPICGTPTNYLRFPVESVRTLAGKTATFSFWAKVPSGTMTIGVAIAQEFGTGGTPSGGVYPLQTNYTVTATWQKFVYTTTMASISGKTIGTNNNDMIWPAIWCPVNAAGTLQLANIKLEQGAVATPFQRRPVSVDLALCQRYAIQEAFNGSGVVRATNTTATITVSLPVRMRATPTMTNISNGATDGFSSQGTSGAVADTLSPLAPNILVSTAGSMGSQGYGVSMRNQTILFSAEL